MAVELEVHGNEVGSELVKGVRIKNVKEKKVGVPGEIAHYHKAEDEFKEWEQACLFIEHTVNDPVGFTINETRYAGKIVVPECVANYLASMESNALMSEAGIFQNKGKEKFIREIHG